MSSFSGNAAVSTPTQRDGLGRFKAWVMRHDDSRLFNVLYIGLALVLSIWLGLFWLALVVALHWLIEVVKQYARSRRYQFALLEATWELKLDLGLVFFALWLGVYMDVIFGVAGLAAGSRLAAQTAGRAAQTGSRAAVWQRSIRAIFLSLDDVGQVAKIALRRKKSDALQNGPQQGSMPVMDILDDMQADAPRQPGWRGTWSGFDWFSVLFGIAFLLLILLAPLLIDKNWTQVWEIIRSEMTPFPG
jgi:hypothetical protein